MKTKPILTAIAGIILLAAMFFISACHHQEKADKGEITRFLDKFSDKLNQGDAVALQEMFEVKMSPKTLKRLLGLLTGKKDFASKEKPFANVTLDVEASDIKQISQDVLTANVQAELTHLAVEKRVSNITFKIRKISAGVYKIIRIDARKFLADYTEYANYIKSKTMAEKDLFAPITIAAFKTAAQLKAKYDSVIWFAHVNDKTYFYVVKGKWSMAKDLNKYDVSYKDSVIEPYSMGLVNPDLKEIIPAEYDLIHNINGTFPGLVEVEKNNKKGFFNLEGKLVVPVNYDQIFALNDFENIAVLRNGNAFFYLKKDITISEKVDLKIPDFFTKIKNLANKQDFYANALSIITEYNSREQNGAIYIAPSYLVDLNMIEKSKDFKNPLRNVEIVNGFEEDGLHEHYNVSFAGNSKQQDSWIDAAFYSIKDYFLGGRSGFYDKKNIVIVDKKSDKVYSTDIETDYGPMGGGSLEGVCDVNEFRVINDSLFEYKAGANLFLPMYDTLKEIRGGPYYHYLTIKNNKLIELPNNRFFGFTKYVKMDDSYLNGCYEIGRKNINRITPEILRYIKNEIFADYRYQFKDKRWQDVFQEMASYNDRSGQDKQKNISVNDSLTEIDKYNINWINQKLKGVKTQGQALAAK